MIGQVVRMRARPTSHLPALAITIEDESGTATAVFSGRRAIGGIGLGRWLTIEGTAIANGARVEFVNPAYTLMPRPAEH